MMTMLIREDVLPEWVIVTCGVKPNDPVCSKVLSALL